MSEKNEPIQVPCIDFGEGRIVVGVVHTPEWAGLALSDAKSPHRVGDYVPGEGPETDSVHAPSKESIYMRFLNVESVDVVLAALVKVREIIEHRAA